MLRLKNGDKNIPLEVTVSNATLFRVAVFVAASFVTYILFRRARHALILIFISFFLTIALNSPVHFIARHLPGKLRGSRVLATSLSYLIVLIVLGAFLASVIPPLVKQTGTFIHEAPHLVNEVKHQNGELGHLIRQYHLQGQVSTISQQIGNRLHHIGGSAFSTIARIASSVFSVLTICVLTFMMLIEGPRWFRLFKRMIPERQHGQMDRIITDMYRVVKGYVNGQVTLSLIAVAFITPALIILKVPYAAALIAVVFICGLIPMVGHTIGAIILGIIGLIHSPFAGIFLFLYYISYEQFENYLIQPMIPSIIAPIV